MRMISSKIEWMNQIKSNRNYWNKEKKFIKKESAYKMNN